MLQLQLMADCQVMVLQAKLILPPDFDDTIEYPVLVKVYGGPGSQAVFRRFGAVADFDT
jgi:dipeptidyl-peptidase-4